MIRIATVAMSALFTLSLIVGSAMARQRGGVQISGDATVVSLVYDAVNAATGFISNASLNVGVVISDSSC
jgi:hypothetical protein